jgi:predicted nuclease with TOPRIM domain
MYCEICGRSSCTRSLHSIEAQEEFDEREEMSENVYDLRCEIQELRAQIKELEIELTESAERVDSR